MTALVRVAPPDAIVACRQVMARGSKSFTAAARLLPPATRDDAAAVYAWCRRADDAVDDPAARDRPAAVARLRAELDAIYRGAPVPGGGPELTAFAAVVTARAIPRVYPDGLLDGMAADAAGARVASLHDLLAYAYQVASTVGLMMCHVMGLSAPAARRHAAHLGLAMQLTNVCRDVAEDWALGRRYVPDELLIAHGGAWLVELTPGAAPLPARAGPPLAACVRALLAEADRFYASADRGLRALPWRAALGVRAARLIYSRIGRTLERRGCDVLAGRVVVSRATKLALAARAIGGALAELPGRVAHPFRRSALDGGIRFPDDVLPL